MVVDLAPDTANRGQRTDDLLRALADETRRDIVGTVLQTPHSVSALARRYPMSFAAVQKHVAVLERAGVVTKTKRGREQLVAGNVGALREAMGALDRLDDLWRRRIERMGDLLASPSADRPSQFDEPPRPDDPSHPDEGAPT